MAPAKAKKHNTCSATGSAGAKLTVNLKNNLVKTNTTKGTVAKQSNNKVTKSVKKSAPSPMVTPAWSGGGRALQADLLLAPGFMSILEQMHNLYTILTYNPTGQVQNLAIEMQKSFDYSMQNQNLLSKNHTKMAASQESNLVTVDRDGFVGDLSYHHGASNGCNQDLAVDGDQVLPPDDVEQHDFGLGIDMDIDKDDMPPPPPLGRLSDLVAPASALQSALQLLSVWDTSGKRHTLILARHVKDRFKKKIWANSYVDLSDLLDKDKDDHPLHVTHSNTSLLTLRKLKSTR